MASSRTGLALLLLARLLGAALGGSIAQLQLGRSDDSTVVEVSVKVYYTQEYKDAYPQVEEDVEAALDKANEIYSEKGILVKLFLLCLEEWIPAASTFDDSHAIMHSLQLDKRNNGNLLDGADIALLLASDELDADSYWLPHAPLGVINHVTLSDAHAVAFAVGHALGGDLRHVEGDGGSAKTADGREVSSAVGYELKAVSKDGTTYHKYVFYTAEKPEGSDTSAKEVVRDASYSVATLDDNIRAINTRRFLSAAVGSEPNGQCAAGLQCPPSRPFPYLNGDYCCAHNQEAYRPDVGDDPPCDGTRLQLDSRCCRDDDFQKCPQGAGQCQVANLEVCPQGGDECGEPLQQFCEWRNTGYNTVFSGVNTGVYLDRHAMSCPAGAHIRDFRLRTQHYAFYSVMRYEYECCTVPDGGSCASTVVKKNDHTSYNAIWQWRGNFNYLDRQTVDCGGGFLSSVKLVTDNHKRTWRYEYACCHPEEETSCRSTATAVEDSGDWATIYLDRSEVSCPAGSFVSRFRLRSLYSPAKHYYELTCCGTERVAAECPPAYPFPYQSGRYCCSTNEEDVDRENPNAGCDGSALKLDSLCCKDHDWLACPYGGDFCQNVNSEVCPDGREAC